MGLPPSTPCLRWLCDLVCDSWIRKVDIPLFSMKILPDNFVLVCMSFLCICIGLWLDYFIVHRFVIGFIHWNSIIIIIPFILLFHSLGDFMIQLLYGSLNCCSGCLWIHTLIGMVMNWNIGMNGIIIIFESSMESVSVGSWSWRDRFVIGFCRYLYKHSVLLVRLLL